MFRQQSSGMLDVTESVIEKLIEKHPEAQESTDGLFQGPLERNPVPNAIFEELDAEAIHKAAKKVDGAAGPSGADAEMWQRLLCSKQFKKKPFELCSAVAALARKLNQKRVNPDYLRAFVAACLIPLDKDLGAGVRPIGIGEVLRRITSSATVTMLKPELIEHTAPLQTCAGVHGGIEASIHGMREIWQDPDTECIILIDATNAFNKMCRKTALKNLDYTCPELANYLRNLYSIEAELFVANSDETILSREGTTQGGGLSRWRSML